MHSSSEFQALLQAYIQKHSKQKDPRPVTDATTLHTPYAPTGLLTDSFFPNHIHRPALRTSSQNPYIRFTPQPPKKLRSQQALREPLLQLESFSKESQDAISWIFQLIQQDVKKSFLPSELKGIYRQHIKRLHPDGGGTCLKSFLKLHQAMTTIEAELKTLISKQALTADDGT